MDRLLSTGSSLARRRPAGGALGPVFGS